MQTIVQTTHTLPWQEIINKNADNGKKKSVLPTYLYTIHPFTHDIVYSLTVYMKLSCR